MASNNKDMVIGQCYQTVAGCLVSAEPRGRCTTLSPPLLLIDGFELDHDDCWIAGASNFVMHSLLSIHLGTKIVTTLWTTMFTPGRFNDIAIDRDPGGPTYAIAVWGPSNSPFPAASPKMIHSDRKGVRRSFQWAGNPLLELSSITLHPRTGNYLTTDFMGPSRGETKGAEVNQVTKTGVITTLGIYVGANAARIDQHDTAWIVGYVGNTQTVVRFDLTRNTILKLIPLTGLPPRSAVTGIDLYGSRRLVCSQPPSIPGTVSIKVQSRSPAAGGASYSLAASFARRPGMKFLSGEWLNLDVTDPLFLLTATNLAPSTFINFRGTLDQAGNNAQPIRVRIPPSLPKLGGVTVFVAGVIHQSARIIQVTNSHWFVLP